MSTTLFNRNHTFLNITKYGTESYHHDSESVCEVDIYIYIYIYLYKYKYIYLYVIHLTEPEISNLKEAR